MQGPPTTNISAQVTKQQDKYQNLGHEHIILGELSYSHDFYGYCIWSSISWHDWDLAV